MTELGAECYYWQWRGVGGRILTNISDLIFSNPNKISPPAPPAPLAPLAPSNP